MSKRRVADRNDKLEAVRVLHAANWSDNAIGAVLEVSPDTARLWRIECGLPAHNVRPTRKIDYEVALQLYREGCSDCAIARHFGMDQASVTRWRQRTGLPTHQPRQEVSDVQKRAARKLLRLGGTAAQVADDVHASKSTIMRMRKKLPSSEIRPTGLTNRSIASQVRRDPKIMKRIEMAVGETLPVDVKQEAMLELYADVLDGRVAREHIEKRAAHYRNKAWELCGSSFGPLSLDAENDDGYCLGDSLDDPDALEELEQAGALAYEWED